MTNKTSNPKHTTVDMLGRTSIVPLSEALAKLHGELAKIAPIGSETLPLEMVLGRIIAQPIPASHDLPPHPRSTMDGYAVHGADTFGASDNLPGYLKISGEVLMGETVPIGPASQECYKIATGGFLPPGTDAVVMLEHTVDIDGNIIEVIKAVSPGENIIGIGDDIRKGSQLLPAGKLLRPQELGLLAGLGELEVTVYKKVRVGIFSTGDEIVSYKESPPLGKMRDMNGVNIAALVRQNLAESKFYGIAADQEEDFSHILEKALTENDMVIFSGSSSVGTRDLGEQIINKLAKPGIIIHGVAIKPGKPVIIAFAGDKPIFGLPGHPVSAAVAFNLFGKPTINLLAGVKRSFHPPKRTVRAKVKRNLNSAPGRTDFIRVKLSEAPGETTVEAHPVLGKSGALSTMVQADGYFIIKESSQGIYQDEMVEVFLFE
jgi:molybdopterin molybdotransferase